MRQIVVQFLIILYFLTAATSQISIFEIVIREIYFIPAVATTMPDNRTFVVSDGGGIQCGQAIKFSSGYITCFILQLVSMNLPIGAMSSPTGNKQRSSNYVLSSTGASASPLDASLWGSLIHLLQNGEIPKGFPRKIKGSFFFGTF